MYLGEKVVSENEYLSAMLVVQGGRRGEMQTTRRSDRALLWHV